MLKFLAPKQSLFPPSPLACWNPFTPKFERDMKRIFSFCGTSNSTRPCVMSVSVSWMGWGKMMGTEPQHLDSSRKGIDCWKLYLSKYTKHQPSSYCWQPELVQACPWCHCFVQTPQYGIRTFQNRARHIAGAQQGLVKVVKSWAEIP